LHPNFRKNEFFCEISVRFIKAESKKNWKETAKDGRTWRDLAEKAKTHQGL
jgi:hypothetical protein